MMAVPTEMKISGVDRMKQSFKQSIWRLPTPLFLLMIQFGCATGLMGRYFKTYHKLGRPPGVLSGPFQGLAYSPFARGSALLPKFLGSYESELHPIVERLAKEPCDVVVDVGAAEGYYAVGLSKILGLAKVHCYEIDPLAKGMLMELAALNGVADRMILGGYCRPVDLQAILRDATNPLVISDCEGGEMELLDPVAAPSLRTARILVEVHDYDGDQTIGNALRERFASTHEIETIATRSRTLSDLPAACKGLLPEEEALYALNEFRGCGAAGWLYLRPIAG